MACSNPCQSFVTSSSGFYSLHTHTHKYFFYTEGTPFYLLILKDLIYLFIRGRENERAQAGRPEPFQLFSAGRSLSFQNSSPPGHLLGGATSSLLGLLDRHLQPWPSTALRTQWHLASPYWGEKKKERKKKQTSVPKRSPTAVLLQYN